MGRDENPRPVFEQMRLKHMAGVVGSGPELEAIAGWCARQHRNAAVERQKKRSYNLSSYQLGLAMIPNAPKFQTLVQLAREGGTSRQRADLLRRAVPHIGTLQHRAEFVHPEAPVAERNYENLMRIVVSPRECKAMRTATAIKQALRPGIQGCPAHVRQQRRLGSQAATYSESFKMHAQALIALAAAFGLVYTPAF